MAPFRLVDVCTLPFALPYNMNPLRASLGFGLLCASVANALALPISSPDRDVLRDVFFPGAGAAFSVGAVNSSNISPAVQFVAPPPAFTAFSFGGGGAGSFSIPSVGYANGWTGLSGILPSVRSLSLLTPPNIGAPVQPFSRPPQSNVIIAGLVAPATVPDGGVTAVLLGASLLVLHLIQSRRRRIK